MELPPELRTEAATPVLSRGLEASLRGQGLAAHSGEQRLTPCSPAGSFWEGDSVGEVGNPGGLGGRGKANGVHSGLGLVRQLRVRGTVCQWRIGCWRWSCWRFLAEVPISNSDSLLHKKMT